MQTRRSATFEKGAHDCDNLCTLVHAYDGLWAWHAPEHVAYKQMLSPQEDIWQLYQITLHVIGSAFRAGMCPSMC